MCVCVDSTAINGGHLLLPLCLVVAANRNALECFLQRCSVFMFQEGWQKVNFCCIFYCMTAIAILNEKTVFVEIVCN